MSRPLIAWARHRQEKRFHAVTTMDERVATACFGSWEREWTAEVVELDHRPLFACHPCWRRYLEQTQAAGDQRAEAAIEEAERSGV